MVEIASASNSVNKKTYRPLATRLPRTFMASPMSACQSQAAEVYVLSDQGAKGHRVEIVERRPPLAPMVDAAARLVGQREAAVGRLVGALRTPPEGWRHRYVSVLGVTRASPRREESTCPAT